MKGSLQTSILNKGTLLIIVAAFLTVSIDLLVKHLLYLIHFQGELVAWYEKYSII